MACLLIGVRLAGGFICNTCYLDFEQPKSQVFTSTAAATGTPVTTGSREASPLIQWACTVMQDESRLSCPTFSLAGRDIASLFRWSSC